MCVRWFVLSFVVRHVGQSVVRQIFFFVCFFFRIAIRLTDPPLNLSVFLLYRACPATRLA